MRPNSIHLIRHSICVSLSVSATVTRSHIKVRPRDDCGRTARQRGTVRCGGVGRFAGYRYQSEPDVQIYIIADVLQGRRVPGGLPPDHAGSNPQTHGVFSNCSSSERNSATAPPGGRHVNAPRSSKPWWVPSGISWIRRTAANVQRRRPSWRLPAGGRTTWGHGGHSAVAVRRRRAGRCREQRRPIWDHRLA